MVGTPSTLGDRVAVGDFADHVFGVVGLNDWSARDIQAWEYVPLGPFLGKSFATSVSHWVTPLEALDAAWVDLPGQDPAPLPYLSEGSPRGLDIDVEVELGRRGRQPAAVRLDVLVARPDARPHDRQRRLAAHRRPVRVRHRLRRRARPARLAAGAHAGAARSRSPDGRTFLEDGDAVTLRYTAPGTGGGRIALGEVTGTVVPAR